MFRLKNSSLIFVGWEDGDLDLDISKTDIGSNRLVHANP